METTKNIISERIIATATDLGSTATTVRGAHRYIMANQLHPLSAKKTEIHPTRKFTTKSKYLKQYANQRLIPRRCIIPLGEQSRLEVSAAEKSKNPRRKNWNRAEAAFDDRAETWTSENNTGRYSSRCRYIRFEYIPTVGSYAIIRGNLGLEYHWQGGITYLHPPKGYAWKKDSHGIKLVSLTNPQKDYHPDSDDLRSYSKRAMLGKIKCNYDDRISAEKLRKEQERINQLNAEEMAQRIIAAEKEGLRVCLRDSLKAGNCASGTMGFAKNNGLDPKKHYRPTMMLKLKDGYGGKRIRASVAVSLARHEKEKKQGFALLEDHQ